MNRIREALSVSLQEMERLWAEIVAKTNDPKAGIFGPSSVSWKINREAALFLGAGRAALMQLAHPWVTAALEQHSNLRTDPLARFHNTFRVVFTMVFGTLAQALLASRQLYELHSRIQGELPSAVAAYPKGSHYHANELHALRWVFATLVESAVIAYESVLPPLSLEERETYYAESKTMAALFGIRPDALPPDWQGFTAYNEGLSQSDVLGVDSLAREMAERVLHGRGSWVPVPEWYRALTAAWLPEWLREEFSLPYGARDKIAAEQGLRRFSIIYRRLPASLRFVGPYQEARARLLGRRVNLITRGSNRFWMGQPRMMSAPPEG